MPAGAAPTRARDEAAQAAQDLGGSVGGVEPPLVPPHRVSAEELGMADLGGLGVPSGFLVSPPQLGRSTGAAAATEAAASEPATARAVRYRVTMDAYVG